MRFRTVVAAFAVSVISPVQFSFPDQILKIERRNDRKYEVTVLKLVMFTGSGGPTRGCVTA